MEAPRRPDQLEPLARGTIPARATLPEKVGAQQRALEAARTELTAGVSLQAFPPGTAWRS